MPSADEVEELAKYAFSIHHYPGQYHTNMTWETCSKDCKEWYLKTARGLISKGYSKHPTALPSNGLSKEEWIDICFKIIDAQITYLQDEKCPINQASGIYNMTSINEAYEVFRSFDHFTVLPSNGLVKMDEKELLDIAKKHWTAGRFVCDSWEDGKLDIESYIEEICSTFGKPTPELPSEKNIKHILKFLINNLPSDPLGQEAAIYGTYIRIINLFLSKYKL